MWSLEILTAALCLVHLTAAKCNSTLVEDIKALNLNNENMLSNLDGIYKFSFLSIDDVTNGTISGPCIKMRFFKEGETSKIEYLGVLNGVYKAELVNGVIEQSGAEGKEDMVGHIVANGPDVIALHICSDLARGDGRSVTFIAVSANAVNAMEKYKEAKENLTKIGIKTGVEMPDCITGDGGPVGEENKKEITANDADENDEEVLDAQSKHSTA